MQGVPARETVVKQGEAGEHFFVVLEGQFRYSYDGVEVRRKGVVRMVQEELRCAVVGSSAAVGYSVTLTVLVPDCSECNESYFRCAPTSTARWGNRSRATSSGS